MSFNTLLSEPISQPLLTAARRLNLTVFFLDNPFCEFSCSLFSNKPLRTLLAFYFRPQAAFSNTVELRVSPYHPKGIDSNTASMSKGIDKRMTFYV
jgi:hypothetical protein